MTRDKAGELRAILNAGRELGRSLPEPPPEVVERLWRIFARSTAWDRQQ
jgi:hypothetical protein